MTNDQTPAASAQAEPGCNCIDCACAPCLCAEATPACGCKPCGCGEA